MEQALFLYTLDCRLIQNHLVPKSASATFEKKITKYSLMQIYSTSVNCVLSKIYSVQNSHEVTKFALVEYFCIIEYSLSAKLS